MPANRWERGAAAIEDSASGKDVLTASVMRVALFVGVALYAWAAVWLTKG
jgi:hypothetical protein